MYIPYYIMMLFQIIMTKLNLTLQPVYEGNDIYAYNYGSVTINVTLDKSQRCKDDYTFMLYNEQLMQLAAARSSDSTVTRRGRNFVISTYPWHIWLPGNYFFLLRDSSDKVLRFDICLDDKATFHCENPRVCLRMSDEDILSGPLRDNGSTWKNLSLRPGAMQLKRWVIERAKRVKLNALRLASNMDELALNNNLILCHRNGHHFGPETIMLLHAAGIETKRCFGHCHKFYDTTHNNPYEELNDFFGEDSSSDSDQNPLFNLLHGRTGKTYVFSEIDALTENGGRQIMKRILANWPGINVSAVFRGTQQEIDALLEQYPTAGEYIPVENRLSIVPYTREEMIHTFFQSLKDANLRLTPEATDKACRVLSEAYRQGLIVHWLMKDIREYVEKHLVPKYCHNVIASLGKESQDETVLEVQPSDIDEDYFLNQSNAYNDAMRELHAMVGLKEIKRDITTLSNRTKFFQERRLMGLHSADDATFHTILTGNPGTGKTTVARLLGKIYHSLGILSKGDVVCVDRTRIIGRYIGETEENMKQILKEAKGNVLFIDEAYTLYAKDDERDFGRHAVECLLDVLGRKDPDMLVIFAGYEKEMNALLSMNQGLVGRFPYKFHFPDYSAEELMQIAGKMLSKDQYELSSEAQTLLLHSISEAVKSNSETFANARWMEQFVRNGIIPAFADRIISSPHVFNKTVYQRIEASDVLAAAERFCAKTIEMKRRTAIGFCA